MIELTTFAVFLLFIGGLSLAFAVMAILADVILPSLARHHWRRPAATYRRAKS
jgi:hypothetical protein